MPNASHFHILNDRYGKQRAVLRRTSSFGGGPLIARRIDTQVGVLDGNVRWTVLFLACLLLFGNYYAYDNPASLNVPLQQYLGHGYDQWQYELNLLYAVYSFPNMFLPLLGGTLIDRFDPSKVMVMVSLLVCLGQTLFSLGVSLKSFPTMVVGRVLFGIGGESVSVMQSSITTLFFKDKELAFALGMNLCIARLGSVMNSIMSPRLASIFSVPAAIWCGTLSCYVSFLSVIALTGILAVHNNKASQERMRADAESAHLLGLAETEEPSFLAPDTSGTQWPIGKLPVSFWIVCMICILLYGTVVPFNNIASDFLMSKWYPGDTQMAGFVMSIPDAFSAFLVPLFGTIVDRYGHRITWLSLCSAIIAGVHAVLGLTLLNPIPSFVFLGISYAIYGVVIWPSVAVVAQFEEEKLFMATGKPVKLLGTAFGISTSALNTGLTLLPLIAASIRVAFQSFTYLELFFSMLACTAFLLCMVLLRTDARQNNVLQTPVELPNPIENDASRTSESSDTASSAHVITQTIEQEEHNGEKEQTEKKENAQETDRDQLMPIIETELSFTPFLKLFSIESRVSPEKIIPRLNVADESSISSVE